MAFYTVRSTYSIWNNNISLFYGFTAPIKNDQINSKMMRRKAERKKRYSIEIWIGIGRMSNYLKKKLFGENILKMNFRLNNISIFDSLES